MNINFYVSHGAPELRNQLCKPNVLTDIYAFGVTFSVWLIIFLIGERFGLIIQM